MARLPVRDFAALHNAVFPVTPPRVGRLYQAGTITTSNLWSDNQPVPSSSSSSPASSLPGGYEMRWWALDRDGSQDDVVADVLVFDTETRANDALRRAASPRCRRGGVAHTARFPSGATNLFWVNPDNAKEWDVVFVRGRRLYRVADSPPAYLPIERLGARMTVDVLACALPDAGCPRSAASTHDTNLATLTVSSSMRGSRRRLTRAQATVYAHAVNLREYDVPG